MTQGPENLDVRAAEPVDRLLHIPNREQTLTPVAQLVDEPHLHVVRVLRLIQKDVLEPPRVALPHRGIIEQLERSALHVGEVEQTVPALELLVLPPQISRALVDADLERSKGLSLLMLDRREVELRVRLEDRPHNLKSRPDLVGLHAVGDRTGEPGAADEAPGQHAVRSRVLTQTLDDRTHLRVQLRVFPPGHHRAQYRRSDAQELIARDGPSRFPVLANATHHILDVLVE